MVAPTGGGSFEATFANTSDREMLAANVALHPATWVMMRLFEHYGVDPEEIGDFLGLVFDRRDSVIARTYGDYDATGKIHLEEGAISKAKQNRLVK